MGLDRKKANLPPLKVRIGTAGWNIPGYERQFFPEEGSHLKRYSEVFNCVEINSSFYRDHQEKTYRRWAESVPASFRFSVKLSKRFTHEMGLAVPKEDILELIGGVLGLGEKLGVVLVQLPPKLDFENSKALHFFSDLRSFWKGPIALEPRHPSWANHAARKLCEKLDLVYVDADPARIGPVRVVSERGSISIHYHRWHGSPEIYRSSYTQERLSEFHERVFSELREGQESWCIFDNTTFGYSIENALDLSARLRISA